MRPLSLEHLTVFDAPAPEIISIAAALDCQAVSLFIQKPNDRVEVPPLVGDLALRQETARRIADTGVKLGAIECFILTPEIDVTAFRPALETGAALGGSCATTVVFDPDEGRAADRYAAFCDLAREFGIDVNLEFLAFSPMNSIAKAADFLKRVGRSNAGLVVDSLHIVRTGGTPADIGQVPASLIRHAQICDGPLAMPIDRQEEEGLEERQIPGEGQFPLADFLAALPPDVMLGVEVPQKRRRLAGVTPLERARLAVDATRRMLRVS